MFSRTSLSDEDLREVSLLLPWYATGSLSRKEKKRVELALAHSYTLQEELETLQRLRAKLTLEGNGQVSAPNQHLERQKEKMRQGDLPRPTERHSWREEIKKWFFPPVPVQQLAVAMIVFTILVETTTIAILIAKRGEPQARPGEITTLSGPSNGYASSSRRVMIAFDPKTSEEVMRDIAMPYGGFKGDSPILITVKGGNYGAYFIDIGGPQLSQFEEIREDLRKKPGVVMAEEVIQ